MAKLAVTDPEYTISIIGLVASFCGQPIVGLVLSLIALSQSKKAERHNLYGFLGLIFSLIQIGLWILIVAAYIIIIGITVGFSAYGKGM